MSPGVVCGPPTDCKDANVNRWFCMRGHDGAPAGVCPLSKCDERGANPKPEPEEKRPNVRRHPVHDGEMEITTEIVSQNDDNTTTVALSFRITKPITIAIFSATPDEEGAPNE